MNIQLDIHCHTVSSGHAYSTIKENAEIARQKGLALFAITDHAPAMPGTCGLFHFMNLGILPQIMDGVELLKGAEVNILDHRGTLDLPDSVLEQLNIVIASLHTPCYAPETIDKHTEAIINTMKNPFVHVIGHLGDARFPFHLDKVVDAAIENNVFLEMNNASLDERAIRKGDRGMMKRVAIACKEKNWPVVFGSDAHFADDVGNFKEVIELMKEIEMPEQLILNTSVERFKKYLDNNK